MYVQVVLFVYVGVFMCCVMEFGPELMVTFHAHWCFGQEWDCRVTFRLIIPLVKTVVGCYRTTYIVTWHSQSQWELRVTESKERGGSDLQCIASALPQNQDLSTILEQLQKLLAVAFRYQSVILFISISSLVDTGSLTVIVTLIC